MNDFKLTPLSELVSRVKVGFVGSINKFYCEKEKGIPLIRTTDICENGIDYSNLKYVTKEFHEKNKKSQIKNGDIIIARHGENGKANVFKEDFDAQVLNAVIIEPNQNKLESNLLKFFFDSPFIKKQISGVVKGSVQGVINTSHVADVLIPMNRKINYKGVSKNICDLDAKIELNNKINAELEAMAKTLYDYWFVQFDFPDANGKPYKSSGGKMVYNKELKREIPEGWEVECIENILEKSKATTKINAKEYLDKGKIPIIDQSTSFICGFTNEENSLISTRDRPAIVFGDHTRILKLINFDFARGADGTQVLFSNNKRIPQHLLYHSLLKIDLSNYGYARHFKFLKDSKVILSDEKIAKEFELIVSNFFKKIKSNIFENQELASLRDWLLPMLMNGQVTVGEALEQLGMVAEEEEEYKK